MRFHELGQSALNVSEVCLGTMTFGQQTRSPRRTVNSTPRSRAASISSTLRRCIRCLHYPSPTA